MDADRFTGDGGRTINVQARRIPRYEHMNLFIFKSPQPVMWRPRGRRKHATQDNRRDGVVRCIGRAKPTWPDPNELSLGEQAPKVRPGNATRLQARK